ncbi:MAG: hypothetical protein AAF721_33415, partial [Myxococcota bacterium]
MGSACAPVYAPPIRAGHFGAPGRLAAGQVEVAGAASGFQAPIRMFGANAGYAVRRNLILQAGADTRLQSFAMGWGGVQVPHRYKLSRLWSLAVDGEAGLG